MYIINSLKKSNFVIAEESREAYINVDCWLAYLLVEAFSKRVEIDSSQTERVVSVDQGKKCILVGRGSQERKSFVRFTTNLIIPVGYYFILLFPFQYNALPETQMQ